LQHYALSLKATGFRRHLKCGLNPFQGMGLVASNIVSKCLKQVKIS